MVPCPVARDVFVGTDSLPPKSEASALPMMPSQSSLNSAFSWLMFCRTMVDMMFRLRM